MTETPADDKPLAVKAERLIDRVDIKSVLAVLAVIALIAAMLLFWYKAPDPSNQILLGLITQLAAIVLLVYNHYFGSTSQSKAKDDTIAKQADALSSAGNTGGSGAPARQS